LAILKQTVLGSVKCATKLGATAWQTTESCKYGKQFKGGDLRTF